MSTSVFPPTAQTTLVILLGASAWPRSPGFQESKAFVYAALGFREYLLNPHGFGLPKANLCDLFDAPTSASDQLEMLGSFLEQRTQALKAANLTTRDVLVYFVGHGGFVGSSADFYLLTRRADASGLRASGMAIDALAEVLQEKARQMRRYLFLDCCFAAVAFHSFQGGPDQTAITKTLDAFHVQAKGRGFPRKGTVLLCSSDQKSPSLLLPDESCTMFSGALLDVLRHGEFHRSSQLSLRDIKELVSDRLAALPEKNAPRPGLYSPDQSEGDAADIPFFPNPRAAQARPLQAPPMRGQPFPSPITPSVAIPPQHSDLRSPHMSSQTALPPQNSPLLPPSPQIASVQHVSAPLKPYTAPVQSVPPRPRWFSSGKNVLLVILTLLIIGGGSVFFLRTALPLTPSQPHGSPTTQVTVTPSTQTPQDLYTQVTQASPDLHYPLDGSGNDPNDWTVATSANISCEFRGGAYHAGVSDAPCILNAGNFSDLAYQVQMTIVTGNDGGILFRIDSSQQKYYTFYIDLSGSYTLKVSMANSGQNDKTLKTGTAASFKTGLGQPNVLTVIAQGSSIYMYINKQFIDSADNPNYTNGQIGVFGGGNPQNPQVDVAFSNAQVWKL